MKIPQRAHEQRTDPVLVEAGFCCITEPPGHEAPPEAGQLRETDGVGGDFDEGALAWTASDESLLLKVSVGLEDRVRVDRE